MSALPLLLSLSVTAALAAQASGLGGAAQEPPLVARLEAPDATTAERLITVEAVAEVRVVPSRLRVVFSVSATGADARAASASCRALLADTKARLAAAEVDAADIDVDFIAVVPVYEWAVEEQGGTEVVAERRTGTRVQYDLHVAVPDESAALHAIEAATAHDGVDLLAVDYWSDELAERQVEAQEKAMAAAQAKAKRLLAVFPEPPRAVNVHERTRVLFPQQLYRQLARAEDSAGDWYSYSRRELPRVPASRPLQVYYRGLFADVDAVESRMPGRRDIEVVSTVRLYFAAPHRPPCPAPLLP